jgi:mRNA interferase HigB
LGKGIFKFKVLFKYLLFPKWEQVIVDIMRILSRSTLRNFWESHPDAEETLKTWYYEASHADWQSPVDVKSAHGNASIIANNRVVFNIKGNTYRLIVAIRYDIGIIFIRFIGNHSEYDKVDAETI